jgi:hypothetical protein
MTTVNDSGSGPDLEFFPGFAWPVPRAFDDAVAQPRFEQGDVLYPEPRSYAPLAGPLPRGLKAIQVLAPPRSVRAGAGRDAEGDRRSSAWTAPVRVAWIDLASGKTEIRELTQGKLFTALWQGDERWLDPDRADPPVPRGARDLQAQLDSARSAFDAAGLGPTHPESGCRFLFVVDESSSGSRGKALQVEDALRARGEVEALSLAPREAGMAEAERYHPALVVRGLWLPGRRPEAVHAVLRATLYAGGADSRDDAATDRGADRFSLSRHGLLEVLPAETPDGRDADTRQGRAAGTRDGAAAEG